MQHCLANWPLILEYLKILLSWPPVAFALVVLLLPTFGSPLTSLLKNLRKGKAAGLEFEIDSDQQKGSTPPPIAEGDHLGKIASDPKLAKAEILKWWRAAADENNFHKIYGTQIRLLEHLSNKVNAADSEANLTPFHREHIKLVEAAGNPFPPPYWTQYFGFLLGTGYVERHASGQVVLTQIGQNFLSYIKATWGAYASTRSF